MGGGEEEGEGGGGGGGRGSWLFHVAYTMCMHMVLMSNKFIKDTSWLQSKFEVGFYCE